uniref:F-box domain-containing protein n=1 Tax=Caenorhabditis tropicalis TaxID=1561998 RepID=A0A1I7UTY1_9PELO
MSAFPLLRLPLLAIDHVLCMLTPYELIIVSLTSSRAKRVVKTYSRIKSKFRVSLTINDQPCISIRGNNLEACNYRWKKPIKEFTKLFNHIKEVFGCVIEHVSFELSSFSRRTNKSIIDCLGDQRIESIEIGGDWKNQSHQDIKYCIWKLKATEVLFLDVHNYKNNFELEIPEGSSKLYVKDAKFIKYEQFLRLKHQEIVLNQPSMTNQDVNRFLKSWMACKSHRDLKSLQITVRGQYIKDEIMMGILYEVTTDQGMLKKFKNAPFHTIARNGFKIKRWDGKVAVLCTDMIWNLWDLCFLVQDDV